MFLLYHNPRFQCSSASRKFLNRGSRDRAGQAVRFQCSSASRKFLNRTAGVGRNDGTCEVSVLFSEPKIPQQYSAYIGADDFLAVSVLFSEPKIPQLSSELDRVIFCFGFSALQRAENSSTHTTRGNANSASRFQCSSASRKFLNCSRWRWRGILPRVSVLFSEPKIPQLRVVAVRRRRVTVSVLFSEPKIPQPRAGSGANI